MRHHLFRLFIGFFFFAFPCLVLGEETELSVGATLALTGKYAFIGTAERDGLLLAQEQVNRDASDGVRISLSVEDNAGDAKSAVTGVQSILRNKGTAVVFSAFTHVTRAIQPLVSSQNRLLVYASSVPDFARDNRLVYRDYLDIQQDAELITNELIRRGLKRIAYLRDDGDVCILHAKQIAERVREGKISLAYEQEFPSGDGDIRSVLSRLRQHGGIDAYLFCAWRDMDSVLRQGDAIGLWNRIPAFFTLAPFLPTADTPALRALLERIGAVSTWYGFVNTGETVEQRQWVEEFQQKFGYLPRADAMYAYDDLRALAAATQQCAKKGGVSSECLADQFGTSVYHGIAGEMRFSSSRSTERPAMLIEVKKGEWRRIGLAINQ